jgi:Domain of unknown function (DUF4129)
MITLPRVTYFLGLAVIETTPLALLLLIIGVGGMWGPLFAVVLAGALVDWATQLWLPVERQRPALLVLAFLVALWLIKARIVGDYGPLSGWGQALGALFGLGSARSGLAYLLLLVGLYSFWRGSRLLGHDSASLRTFFIRATVAVMLIVGFGFWLAGGAADNVIASATVMVLAFFAVSLLSIALAGASEEHDAQLRRLGWRGLLTLVGAIMLVLIVGLLLVSLFGGSIVQGLFSIWTVFVTILVLIMLPLFFLIEAVVHWIFSTIDLTVLKSALEKLQIQQSQQQQQANGQLHALPPWVSAVIQVLLGLLPVVILVALFLLMRRRARRPSDRDEERESLWSWRGVAGDLRSLFAGLRIGRDRGLRGVLAQLRGSDPVSRIRRSYIRLLLVGETHERPRTPPQTPREYEPDADRLLPTATQPIATLTSAYERARYHPSASTTADADAAERAWSVIDGAERRG